MRSLQPPDILWIHWRVYNSIANTSKGGTLLPPSDAYVRSFPYLLYTLIKLYYTKALSDPALSLALDWIHLLQRPKIPQLIIQQQPFSSLEVKVSSSNAGDPGSTPRSGRSPGEGNGNPLQYSCLENPTDGGAWKAKVHWVTKRQTRLSNFTLQYRWILIQLC